MNSPINPILNSIYFYIGPIAEFLLLIRFVALQKHRFSTRPLTAELLFSITLVLLLVSDSFYATIGYFAIPDNTLISCIQEVFWVAYSSLLCISLHLYTKTSQDKHWFRITIPVIIYWSIITVKYVLLPFYSRDPQPLLFIKILDTFYGLTQVYVIATSATACLAAATIRTQAFYQSILFLSISDFGTRYIFISSVIPVFNWVEAGWALSMIALAIVVWSAKSRDDLSFTITKNINSIHRSIALMVFLANILLVVILYNLNAFSISNGFDVTATHITLFMIWLGSNAIGLYYRSQFETILFVTNGNSQISNTFEFNSTSPDRNPFKYASRIGNTIGIIEFDQIIDGYNTLVIKLRDIATELVQRSKFIAIGELSARVAHDIRSPLAALNVAIQDLSNIESEKQQLIKGGIARLTEIANELLNDAKLHTSDNKTANREEPELISTIIEKIIEEKKASHSNAKSLFVTLSSQNNALCVVETLTNKQLRQIMSNILENSIEASGKDVTIHVSISEVQGKLAITVSDNGKGMPKEVLSQITRPGFTFEKQNGNGFGLYFCKQVIENANGAFDISSTVGVGTTVKLTIPITQEMGTSLHNFSINNASTIVVVDDLPDMKSVWEQKLIGKKIVFFQSGSELVNWYRTNLHTSFFLICDLDIKGDEMNGIELISCLSLTKQAALVTGHAREAWVKTKCRKLGIQLLDKSSIPSLTIIP